MKKDLFNEIDNQKDEVIKDIPVSVFKEVLIVYCCEIRNFFRSLESRRMTKISKEEMKELSVLTDCFHNIPEMVLQNYPDEILYELNIKMMNSVYLILKYEHKGIVGNYFNRNTRLFHILKKYAVKIEENK